MARLPDPAVNKRWSRLIQQHEQSDLTISDFCDLHEISTASFYQWRRKIRDQADPQGEFLAVEVSELRSSAHDVRVRFPCGTQIELDARDTESLWSTDSRHAIWRCADDRSSDHQRHLPL